MSDEEIQSIDDLAKMLSQALAGIDKVLEAMNNNLADIRIMLRADMESRTRIISTALEEFEKSHVVGEPTVAEGFSPPVLQALRKNRPCWPMNQSSNLCVRGNAEPEHCNEFCNNPGRIMVQKRPSLEPLERDRHEKIDPFKPSRESFDLLQKAFNKDEVPDDPE